MRHFHSLVVSALGYALCCASSAQAEPGRIFVSGKGVNATTCGTSAAPCRTFQYAHNRAPAGGEIVVMDSGAYGPVRITKSVAIVNDGGGVALIDRRSAGPAIDVLAPLDAKIVLRGLTVEGANLATHGVNVSRAQSIAITDCTFRNFSGDGVHIDAQSGPLSLAFAKVDATDNGASGVYVTGVHPINGSIADSGLNRNAHGLYVLTYLPSTGVGATITVSGGEADGNSVVGYRAESFHPTNPVQVTLNDVTVSNNLVGGAVQRGAGVMHLARSVVSGHPTGFGGDNVKSLQNNVFSANSADFGTSVGSAPRF